MAKFTELLVSNVVLRCPAKSSCPHAKPIRLMVRHVTMMHAWRHSATDKWVASLPPVHLLDDRHIVKKEA